MAGFQVSIYGRFWVSIEDAAARDMTLERRIDNLEHRVTDLERR